MDDKFAKFHAGVSNMRKKVIEAKGGQQVQGLSKPVISNNRISQKDQTKSQEKN